jgi:hypothetical protein
MKLTNTNLALLVAILVLPMAAVGQDEETSTRLASVDEPIDNIVVSGQKSEATLLQELWKAEDDFYSLYNSLNDDGLYTVRCVDEAPIGSRIKVQVCRPVFVARAMTNGDVINVTDLNNNPVIADEMATYRKKMNTLIAANPELQAAVATFGTARARYVEAGGKLDQ